MEQLHELKMQFQETARQALLHATPTTVEQWLSEAISTHYDEASNWSDPPGHHFIMSSKKALMAQYDSKFCDVEFEISDNAVGLAWSTQMHTDGMHHYECTVCSLEHASYIGIVQEGSYKAHHSLEAQGTALRLCRGEPLSGQSYLRNGEECSHVTPTMMGTTGCVVGVTLNLNQCEVIFFVEGSEVWRLRNLKVDCGTRFALSNSGFGGKFQVTYEKRASKPALGYGFHAASRCGITPGASPITQNKFWLLKQQNCGGVVSEQNDREPEAQGVMVEFENWCNNIGVLVDPVPMAEGSSYELVFDPAASGEVWFGILEASIESIVSRTACEIKPLHNITFAISSKGKVRCPASIKHIQLCVDSFSVGNCTIATDMTFKSGHVCVDGVIVASVGQTPQSFHFAVSNDGRGASATIYRRVCSYDNPP